MSPNSPRVQCGHMLVAHCNKAAPSFLLPLPPTPCCRHCQGCLMLSPAMAWCCEKKPVVVQYNTPVPGSEGAVSTSKGQATKPVTEPSHPCHLPAQCPLHPQCYLMWLFTFSCAGPHSVHPAGASRCTSSGFPYLILPLIPC